MLSTAFRRCSFRFGCLWYISSQERQKIWLLQRSHRTAGVELPQSAQDLPGVDGSSIVGIGAVEIRKVYLDIASLGSKP